MNIYRNTHDVSVQESASDTPDDYDQLMLFNFRHESEKMKKSLNILRKLARNTLLINPKKN